MYPAMTGCPVSIIEKYVNLANQIVREDIWTDWCEIGRGLFTAHFCALYQKAASSPLIGAVTGAVTSKSVAGVSVSYDTASVTSDLKNWGAFKTTQYGTEFATLAKLVGKGALHIW